MNDQHFMSLALEQAREAAACGEIPVGAVVVRHGVVIATGRNAPIEGHDPTAHAEMVALRAAGLALGNYRLDECELFVTLEPCAMCSGAMLNARLKRVVFAAAEPKTGAAGSVVNLFALPQLNHHTCLQGEVLAEASRALLLDFFRQRRAAQREASRLRHPLRDDALRTPDAAFEGLLAYPWLPHYISDLPALAGLRLHYLDERGIREEGSAGSLTYLCLHGDTNWSYEFCQMIPALLQAGHRVVAPDLIGFGKSDKPKKDGFHRFDHHRQILIELVEKLNLNHIVLVLPARGSLLGLTLPMAAAWRYQALRVMASMTNWSDMPLWQGYQLWKDRSSEPGNLWEPPEASLSTYEKGTAWQAPFPDQGHCAALRAFVQMPFDVKTADGLPILERAFQFWRTQSVLPT